MIRKLRYLLRERICKHQWVYESARRKDDHPQLFHRSCDKCWRVEYIHMVFKKSVDYDVIWSDDLDTPDERPKVPPPAVPYNIGKPTKG